MHPKWAPSNSNFTKIIMGPKIGPKMYSSREFKGSPRGPQGSPRGPQVPQEAPKAAQEAPKKP